jgi:hypothetical protein
MEELDERLEYASPPPRPPLSRPLLLGVLMPRRDAPLPQLPPL